MHGIPFNDRFRRTKKGSALVRLIERRLDTIRESLVKTSSQAQTAVLPVFKG